MKTIQASPLNRISSFCMLAALILHIRRPATAQIKIYVNTDLEGIKGLSREAAVLYLFEETRKALYEGAKRVVSLITKCKPYRIKMPVKVKMQQLKNRSRFRNAGTRNLRMDFRGCSSHPQSQII